MNTPIAVATLACLLLAACENSNDADRAVGQLESDRIELTAEFSEPITERLVSEGQTVTAGEPILVQDTQRASARLNESEALLAQNKARLDELIRGPRQEQIVAAQARVQGAVKDVDFRETEYRRAQSLLDQGLASPDVRDRAKAALDAADAGLDFDRARLSELLGGTTPEELEQARALVQRAESQLQQASIDLLRLTTSAPADGVIDSLLFEPGERPQPGQPMAIMLSGEQPYARVYIPEIHRIGVSPGTEARVFVDGLSEPLRGRVRWIASDAAFTPYFALTEHDRGRLTYLAKIDLETSDPRLPDGVPVEIELLTSDSGKQ